MERLNKIFAEWAKEDKKTELASEKVELAITDDIRDLVKDSFFQRDQVVFILNDAQKKAKSEAQDGLNVTNEALKLIDEFKRKAKDLGLDSPAFIQNAEKQMNERKKDFQKYIKG